MKNFFALSLVLSCFLSLQAQGLIVNEMSNGTLGTREYIELLVIGSAAAPLAPVDLRGWIIDDNNGSFQTSVGTGVAAGHFRIAPSCATFAAVPVGSIILIYNDDDKDAGLPAVDLTDANNDKVYVLPHTAACLEVCTTVPNSITPVTTYTGCAYQTTTLLATSSPRSWTAISMGNAADAVQVRRPDFSFFHGFAYGTVTAPFPTFAAELGGGTSFNIATGTNATRSNVFSCGAFNANSNYTTITAATQTAGAANNSNNSFLIQNIRAGNFNYNNPLSPNPCASILPIYLLNFDAKTVKNYNQIYFAIHSDEDFANVWIEKSADGFQFETIGEYFISEKQSFFERYFIDNQPFPLSYYRLKMQEPNGTSTYSDIRVLRQNKPSSELLIYPNPAKDVLNIEFAELLPNEAFIQIINAIGQVQSEQIIPVGTNLLQIDTQNLNLGAYFVRVQNGQNLQTKRFIRQ